MSAYVPNDGIPRNARGNPVSLRIPRASEDFPLIVNDNRSREPLISAPQERGESAVQSYLGQFFQARFDRWVSQRGYDQFRHGSDREGMRETSSLGSHLFLVAHHEKQAVLDHGSSGATCRSGPTRMALPPVQQPFMATAKMWCAHSHRHERVFLPRGTSGPPLTRRVQTDREVFVGLGLDPGAAPQPVAGNNRRLHVRAQPDLPFAGVDEIAVANGHTFAVGDDGRRAVVL